MEISFKKDVKFGELDFGEVFMNDCGDFFMKIRPIEDINAIDLIYGRSFSFDDNLEVQFLDAKLIVNH